MNGSQKLYTTSHIKHRYFNTSLLLFLLIFSINTAHESTHEKQQQNPIEKNNNRPRPLKICTHEFSPISNRFTHPDDPSTKYKYPSKDGTTRSSPGRYRVWRGESAYAQDGGTAEESIVGEDLSRSWVFCESSLES